MAEYIEREALIKALETDFNTDWADYASKNNFGKDYIDGVRDEYDDVLKIICQQKAAGVQTVKHGKWEEIEEYGGWGDTYFRCSICGDEWDLDTGTPVENGMKYCPKCGARMDGEKPNE